jgi:hypothetical protein
MKRPSLSMRFNAGLYGGQYLRIRPRLTHCDMCCIQAGDLWREALSRKTSDLFVSGWLNGAKHSLTTSVSPHPSITEGNTAW